MLKTCDWEALQLLLSVYMQDRESLFWDGAETVLNDLL